MTRFKISKPFRQGTFKGKPFLVVEITKFERISDGRIAPVSSRTIPLDKSPDLQKIQDLRKMYKEQLKNLDDFEVAICERYFSR